VQIPAVQNSLSSAGKSAGTRFVTRRDRVLIRLGDEDERVIGEALASTQEHWYMSHGTRERRARARIDSIYNAERPQRNKLPSITHELTIRRSNALRHSSHSSDLMYTICEHTNTRDASERREPFYFTVRSFFSCLPPLPTIQVRPVLNIIISPLSFPSSSCAASEALPFALTGTTM